MAATATIERPAKTVSDRTIVSRYLEQITRRKPRGRVSYKVDPKACQGRLDQIIALIAKERNPLAKLRLTQERLELQALIAELGSTGPSDDWEPEFILVAKSFSDDKGISYSAWREVGVSADVLRQAGIARTRGAIT